MGRASSAAVGVCLLIAGAAAGGCSDQPEPQPKPHATEIHSERVAAELPAGWSEIDEATSRIITPSQVFAVASESVTIRKPLRACHPPDSILAQLPRDGAYIEVSEGSAHGIHPRPQRLRLNRRSYDTYECSGPSHSLSFNERGRGLYVHAWFDPDRVSKATRKQAAAFINSLDVGRFGSRECSGDYAINPNLGFRGADGLSCADAALKWRDWIEPPAGLAACPSTFAHDHLIRATENIACQAVERFILEDFAPHPGGYVERASRFDCRIREPGGNAPLAVDCIDTDRGPSGPRFSFRFV